MLYINKLITTCSDMSLLLAGQGVLGLFVLFIDSGLTNQKIDFNIPAGSKANLETIDWKMNYKAKQ